MAQIDKQKDRFMSGITYVLAIIVMFAVVIVLIRGLWNLMKGDNPSKSNRLMQMRILLQLIAVILIVATIWLAGGGH